MKLKERKSLCEESMLVFVNILKLSSLSLARRTLVKTSNEDDSYEVNRVSVSPTKRTTANGYTKEVYRRTPSLVPVPEESQRTKKTPKRLQKPEQAPESKQSYVMLPEHDENATVDGQFSDYIRRFHEKTQNDIQNAIVEGKAANYIKKFHEKNMKDLNNESMRRSHYVLPPPPSQVFK